MKKQLISLIGASLLVAAPMAVLAGDDNPEGGYVSIHGLGVIPEDSTGTVGGAAATFGYDNGYGIGVRGGYRLPNRFSVEGEITYRDLDLDTTIGGVTTSGSANSVAAMANILYDVDTNSNIVPYFGGGLGVVDIDGDDTVFAYQLMTGAAYTIDSHNEVYAGYRYFGSEGIEEGATDIDYESHNVEVGYRYRF